jgi:flagellar motor switch protein FliM
VAQESWNQDLTALVLTVPFPVRTILAEPEVAISQLSRLAVGDVLSIRLPPQMDLSVGGIRIAKGTVGDHEGRAAFRLD